MDIIRVMIGELEKRGINILLEKVLCYGMITFFELYTFVRRDPGGKRGGGLR